MIINRLRGIKMILCKHCQSEKIVRSGVVNHKQRYKCKECKRMTRDGDLRVKYTNEQKLRVLKMHNEGVGLRSIERLENIPNPLIIKWIRQASKIIRQKINETDIPEDFKQISILELDELFSYCQKKLTKSTYGLLLIGTEIKLLISK